MITMASFTTTTIAGGGATGGAASGFRDDAGTAALFNTPNGCAVDGTGTFALIVRVWAAG
jgi:hypothetical protein